MKRLIFILLPVLVVMVYLTAWPASWDVIAQSKQNEVSLSIVPEKILQGEPVLIAVNGLESVSDIKSLNLDGKNLGIFPYLDKPSALVGIDLRARVGTYPLSLTLVGGERFESELVVTGRTITVTPLGIPEKLGGNTVEAEQELVKILREEAKTINSIPSAGEKLWEGEFRFPVDPPVVVTDGYGYSRQTGSSNISHKGTDFRAEVGTSVYAMNSGKVVLAKNMRNYGNTLIIDHGFGLHTVYMHLSKVSVSVGDKVDKGERIAFSGDTGYVLGPHLHLSVRIGAVSIDPMKFMEIFGE